MEKCNTRQKLIEAGVHAMLAKGYNGVGIKEILDMVGVPKGSFYHYFRSKEEFGVAVIEHYAEDYCRTTRSILLDRSEAPLQRLRLYFSQGRDCHAQNRCRHGCLLAKLGTEVSDLSPLMRAALKSGLDQWLALFTQCLREAQIACELDKQHNPENLAEFLLSSWEGAIFRMQIDRTLDPLDVFFEYVFGYLLVK